MLVFGPLAQWHPLRRRALGVLAALTLALAPTVQARQTTALPEVALAQLPVEAQTVHTLILSGGPFPHAKDGTIFGNRERLLPRERRGFYREYTVALPRARDRGPRRIVCGGEVRTQPEACYYTADHYSSFQKIAR